MRVLRGGCCDGGATDRLRAWLSAEVVRPLAVLLDTSADTTNAAIARFCSTVNTAPFITVTPLRVGSTL